LVEVLFARAVMDPLRRSAMAEAKATSPRVF
jgi:hypothetical protein